MDVLFEDHHLIVVNKPAPLLTQAPPGIPSLEAIVKQYIKVKYEKPAGVYLGIPHRLDRPVSGVVCFARNTKAAQRVHAQFQDRRVTKVYWAIVQGKVEPQAGEWVDWLRKIQDEGKVERAEEGEYGAKQARLAYRVVQQVEPGSSLIEFAPLTGRMHQLRVQSAWRGHSIWGDAMYGSALPFGPAWENPRDKVIALHGRSLELEHPFTKERLMFTAPLPSHWPVSVDLPESLKR